MPNGFVQVARVAEIPDRRSKRVTVGDHDIALWHVDGGYYAISNVCSHQHIPALHLGLLEGLRVTCPMHGWTYSLVTGLAESGEGRVRTFKVIVEGDAIFIEDVAPLW